MVESKLYQVVLILIEFNAEEAGVGLQLKLNPDFGDVKFEVNEESPTSFCPGDPECVRQGRPRTVRTQNMDDHLLCQPCARTASCPAASA